MSANWTTLALGSHSAQQQRDGSGMVFAGVYGAHQLPGKADGTLYWVAASCTHLLPGRSLDSPRVQHQQDGRPRTAQLPQQTCDADLASEERRAARLRLERKLALLRGHGLAPREIAEVLEVDEGSVRLQESGGLGTRELQATRRHAVEWNDGFEFLVSRADRTQVRFEVFCKGPGRGAEELSLGSCEFSVADLLQMDCCTSVQAVPVRGTDITLNVRLQFRHRVPTDGAGGFNPDVSYDED